MNNETLIEQRILEKIQKLPIEKMVELENFLDLLYERDYTLDRSLSLAATKLSEPSLEKIWNNPEDAEYDNL